MQFQPEFPTDRTCQKVSREQHQEPPQVIIRLISLSSPISALSAVHTAGFKYQRLSGVLSLIIPFIRVQINTKGDDVVATEVDEK
jgi:hypothetical protein